MTDKIDILTPVGRMVQGHPFDEQTKDAKGNPLLVKTGPNIGQPRVEYFLAIAVPKTDPQYAAFFQQIQLTAQAGFPGGESQLPTFAWKIKDGDDPKYKDKIGFPGHWVINCSGGFQPKVFTAGGASQIVDSKQIKRGDYVRVYLSVRGNGQPASQAGVYLNPSMVELVGYGEEIISGPSGDAVFGATPAALPAGASATPVASATPIAAGAPSVAAPVPPAPAAPAAPVTPAPDFLNPDDRQVNVNGQVHTVGALKAANWTDDQIAALPAA